MFRRTYTRTREPGYGSVPQFVCGRFFGRPIDLLRPRSGLNNFRITQTEAVLTLTPRCFGAFSCLGVGIQ